MKTLGYVAAVLSLGASCAAVAAPNVVADAMATPPLRNVRLKGAPAEKMNDLFRARLTGDFAKKHVFGEARRAFEFRDDDRKGHGGIWRGEFWGKNMLSAARVADYLNDPAYTAWIAEECHRMIALQDPDGYLGSYADKELVSITDPDATKKTYGWLSVWNIWNRKYAMWAMLMAYKTTGDKAILVSVERQMNQLIDMLHRRNLRLHDTGASEIFGLPSMSLLKPLVMLYEETGNRKYLDFAAEMLPDWDREDNMCPNFFRNVKKPCALHEWYPNPGKWAKTYEFLSCVDGLVEYYRATGDRRCLDTAKGLRDNLKRTDSNVFGGVGFGDKMIGAPHYFNALNEVCDIIHWIRLNVDLFLVTGDKAYLDSVEQAYFNGYLAGIWRGGQWGPFFIRGHQRHTGDPQCGYLHQNCCVNNLPRTFMDIASVAVTRDRAGAWHVNLYQDATVTLDGVTFDISGNYPVDSRVTVRVTGGTSPEVKFRTPGWCPKMEVTAARDVAGTVYTLDFDMNDRVVDRLECDPKLDVTDRAANWAAHRYAGYWCPHVNTDLIRGYRQTAAAVVMHGPLLLARSRLAGATYADVAQEPGVNGKGYAVRLTPLESNGRTWGRWALELTKEGAKPYRAVVSDFQSGSDVSEEDLFSVWF